MDEQKISNILIEHGESLFDASKAFVKFTGDNEADTLLNDLKNHSHAFVLACVMDRQVRAEIAWMIPFRFQQKLGDFSISTLVSLSKDDIKELMTKPEPLHRYPEKMSNNFYQAIKTIDSKYNRDVSKIWIDEPPSAKVVYQFLQFRGVGPKIATMATNILARDFKVKFSDYYSIDISADVHIRRVFTRLGLVQENASIEEIIYKARALYPDFPGLMDLPVWEIGRNWCKAKTPSCESCYMSDVCISSKIS